MRKVISFTHFLQGVRWQYHFLLSRNALAITDTELKLIAVAAIIGLNNIPKNGNKIPAAIGIPIELYINAKNKFCLMFRMT